MSIFSSIGHLFESAVHPQQKKQQPKPVINVQHLVQGLHNALNSTEHAVAQPVRTVVHPFQHIDQNVARAIAGVSNTRLRGVEQATGKNNITVGKAANTLVNKPIVQPAIRTGENIGNIAISKGLLGKGLQPYAKKVNTKQALEDAATTALNAAPGTEALAKGAFKGAKIIGAETKAGFPLAQNAVGAVGRDIKPLIKEAKPITRGLTKGVKNSPEVSSETRKLVDSTYVPKNNSVLTDASAKLPKRLGSSYKIVSDALDVPTGKINDQTVANTIAVAKAHDAKGNFEQASNLYDKLAEHLTESGRTIQAASLLARRTPEGLHFSSQKALKKAGVTITKEINRKLQNALTVVKNTKEGTPERDMAVAKYQQLVAKHIPSSNTDKALAIWKAGLLSGVKTQGGNALSNITFGGLKTASNPLAAAVDKLISLKTGQRTKTFTLKGLASGAKEGTSKGINTFKTGIDSRNLGTLKYEQGEINFKNPVLNKVVNGVFRSMNAADQPYYFSALRNNLNDLAKADGLNKGLGGKELASHMKQFIKEPPKEALQVASDAASKSVLGYDTALSKLVGAGRQALDRQENPLARTAGKVALNVVAPFTRVPSAFLLRTLDFTPVGAVKTAAEQIARKGLDQRALSEAIAEATTGSAVIYLGAQLAKSGQLSGDYPNSPTEQARWKAEGITPNSVKIGDTWYSMNYLGPVGLLFGAGKNLVDAVEQKNNPVIQAIAGLGKGLQGQSFLQGLSGFSNAIQDPGRYGSNLVKSQAASIVPSIVNDVGNATDSMQRQANSIPEAIKARIPGIRKTLNPKQDSLGRDLKQPDGGLNAAINPLKPSRSTSTPLTNELDRLSSTGNSIFPTTDKTLKVGKNTIKLNGDQQYQWNQTTGQQTSDLWNQIINDPTYQSLPDAKKKSALTNAQDDVNAVNKVLFLQSLGEPQNDNMRAAYDNLTKSQKDMVGGKGYVATDYLNKQQTKAPKVKVATAKKAKVTKAKAKKVAKIKIKKPDKLVIGSGKGLGNVGKSLRARKKEPVKLSFKAAPKVSSSKKLSLTL